MTDREFAALLAGLLGLALAVVAGRVAVACMDMALAADDAARKAKGEADVLRFALLHSVKEDEIKTED